MLMSCEGLIEISTPANLITADKVFEDAVLLDDAMANCYRTLDFHEQFLPYMGLYVDELTTISQLVQHQEFLTNSLTPLTNLGSLSVWRALYSTIYQANFIVEGLEETDTVSLEAEVYRRVLGEAKFVRAYSYFYLVNLWGEIPLLLTANVGQTSSAKRHPVTDIYEQIISDLSDAEDLLSTVTVQTKNRASSTAAAALLARVFLYQEDWLNAEIKSADVIRKMRPLTEGLEGVFREGHDETILELWKDRSYSYGSIFIPASLTSVPTFMVRDKLLDLFDEHDKRKSAYLSANDNGQYFPYKYKLRTSGVETEFDVLLRLPELYLINAEAKLRLGDIAGGIGKLNTMRGRVGLDTLDESLQEDAVMQELLNERVREFFCEGAHRFFDLKRTRRLDSVMTQMKPTWTPHSKLFPIPQQELDRNPSLVQNDGYN